MATIKPRALYQAAGSFTVHVGQLSTTDTKLLHKYFHFSSTENGRKLSTFTKLIIIPCRGKIFPLKSMYLQTYLLQANKIIEKIRTDKVNNNLGLTVSQTSPGFYVSAV